MQLNQKTINYWLFQGNPELYNFELAIKDNVLDAWSVTAHWTKIKEGDKAIIWLTGKNGGIGGLAQITFINPPGETISRDAYCWTEKGKKNRENEKISWAAGIKINTNTNLFSKPIFLKKENIQGLEKLNVGRGFQNTNYMATENQYKIISGLIEHSSHKL